MLLESGRESQDYCCRGTAQQCVRTCSRLPATPCDTMSHCSPRAAHLLCRTRHSRFGAFVGVSPGQCQPRQAHCPVFCLLLLFDLAHLLATADFLMRHGARAGAALHINDFGFAGITTESITGLSGHCHSPLWACVGKQSWCLQHAQADDGTGACEEQPDTNIIVQFAALDQKKMTRAAKSGSCDKLPRSHCHWHAVESKTSPDDTPPTRPRP